MKIDHSLPAPPFYRIEVLEDLPTSGEGFLRRVSRRVCTVSPDGTRSEPLIYDEVDRTNLDAVVVAPHFVGDLAGKPERFVVLRSAIRPPIALRPADRSPVAEQDNRGLWELPAGLVDEDELGALGLRQAAARELLEETGFSVSLDALCELGPSAVPAPGVIAERHFFFHVEVDVHKRQEATLDGSPLEAAGELIALPLRACLDAARRGLLQDAKTELALRRLQEELKMRAGEAP